jgi:hypothetical protein
MRALGRGSIASLLTVLLDVGWYGVALWLVLVACLVVISLFGDLSGGEMDIPVSFSVDARTLHVTAPSPGNDNARLRNVRGNGDLTFTPPSRAFLASTAGSLLLLAALVLWVIGQLRAVFRTLRAGQPFVPANASRIRRIGYVVILGELGRSALVLMGNHYTMRHFAADGLRFGDRPDVNIVAIVTGLIILVISEVFRAGTRLDEEQSLTV